MKNANRIAAVVLALLLLGATALAAPDARSEHGAFAALMGDSVYASLSTGEEYALFSVPAAGGDLTKLDSAPSMSDLVEVNGSLYYLRTVGAARQIAKIDASGAISTLCEFENDVQVDHLSFYDDVLYCLAGGRLYIVDPENGDSTELCDILIDDYVIASDVIFYIASADQRTYERTVAGQDELITQSSGTLGSMSILGTNPEMLLDKGVTDLRAYANFLYFHNLEDNYVMGSTDEMWLEGKLYRYNIETAQTASLNLDYDWDFYPTDAGLVVYTSQDISLYPLTGGEGEKLMTPGLRTEVTAFGDNAYVYEYEEGRLTRLALDGSGETVLVDDSDVLPDVTGATGTDATLLDDDADTEDGDDAEPVGDQTYDEESGTVVGGSADSYIFPNSSTKKLTREQVLAIDKSLWGYARNEIYARHGYAYKNSKYKTYFEGKSWYKPGGFSSGALNSVEWYNMELIKDLEREHGLISASSGSSKSSAKNNYYILKEASSKRLTKSYLRRKLGSKSKYALARNEILARHGYVFKTAKYKKYFNNQKWYKPGGYSSGNLSRTEWHNIELLKELENS